MPNAQQAQQEETQKNSPTPREEFEHTKKQADREHELKTKELEVKQAVTKESDKPKKMAKSEEKVLLIEILN